MAYTSKKPPFNVTIVNPEEYISRWGILPVSNHAIYEPSSEKFHPDGFFSEVIFGQIGSNERLIKKGYIDLRTAVITPHLYNQLIKLKGFYKDILAGRQYAYFDEEIKDFVKTNENDPNGSTGYSFFTEHLPKIVFQETDSSIRHMRIELFKKYADRIFMRQMIVIPAGMRDVRMNDGRATSEDINKLYFSLLSLTKAMPEETDESMIKVFDGIRYQIQTKVQEIYQYIANLFDGKGGFAQSKYASRSVTYAGRNVITATPISRVASPRTDQMFSIDEVEVPLFQAIKEAQPLIVNKLIKIFFEQIFHGQSLQVPLIDSNYHLNMHTISQTTLKRFTSSEGIADIINEFRDPHVQKAPVVVQVEDDTKTPHYLYMVYDKGDEIYLFRNKEDFIHDYSRESTYSLENITNLSYVESFPKNDFIILGSTALRVYGMQHYNQDLDLLVSDTIFEQIKSSGEYERQDNGVWRNKNGFIDIYNELFAAENIVFEEEKKHAYTLESYSFFSPERMLALYRKSNRLKDKDKLMFLESIVPEKEKMRPLTYAEMLYIAAYAALKNRHATATRHPVLNLEGIAIFKIHVMSTEPSRTVKLRQAGKDTYSQLLPNYPKMDGVIKASMSMHPATLDSYGGKMVAATKSLKKSGNPR